ncbi:hypothetical protein BDR06DRAFT_969433 [Suillus hirtellus]|nr:hypothetical protein BDR06DRAFT_969433 [Suillus hirtellus]
MAWINSSSNKKLETEVAHLVKEVILVEDFDSKHLEDFSVKSSLQELDHDPGKSKIEFPDDWIQASITIKIPTKLKEDNAKSFSVPGFHFCPLIEVIWSPFIDIQASAFHLLPFRHLWKDPLDNHQEYHTSGKLQNGKGVAPIYVLQKSDKVCLLGAKVQCLLPCKILTINHHFVHAYYHGIVLKCADADYPEKVLIATIKDIGACLLKDMKSHVTNIQIYILAKIIKAQEYIYNGGKTMDSIKVNKMLREGSWVPVLNTFVKKLGALGLNPFCILVVDFMHECKLGT